MGNEEGLARAERSLEGLESRGHVIVRIDRLAHIVQQRSGQNLSGRLREFFINPGHHPKSVRLVGFTHALP